MRETNLSSIDLNLLVALEALLDEGSVSRAARRLGRTQPAVSRMLARLREMLGDELLVKQGRGLVATPRAREVREAVKLVLGDVRAMLRGPAPFPAATERRRFRLISSDYAHVVLVGRIMDRLRESAPGVTLSVAGLDGDPRSALASGEADLLVASPEACPPWGEAEALLTDSWACVRRRGEPLPATVDDYLALGHIATSLGRGFGDPVEAALRRRKLDRQVRLTVSDLAGALFVAAQSSLCATVPLPVARRGAALMPLDVCPAPFAIPAPVVAMIWPRRLSADPAHAWLRAAVRASVEP